MFSFLREAGTRPKTDRHTHNELVRQTPVQTHSANEASLSLPLPHRPCVGVYSTCGRWLFMLCLRLCMCVRFCALFIAAHPLRPAASGESDWLTDRPVVTIKTTRNAQYKETLGVSQNFFLLLLLCFFFYLTLHSVCLCGSVRLSASAPDLDGLQKADVALHAPHKSLCLHQLCAS